MARSPKTVVRKRAPQSAGEPERALEPPLPMEPEAASAPPRPEGGAFPEPVERLGFKIADGKIDTGALRSATAEKLRSTLKASINDPEFRKWAGLEAPATPANVSEMSKSLPMLVGAVLDGASMLESSMLAKRSGLEYAEVYPFMRWLPEEHAILDPQGTALLLKYVPAEWLEKADLFAFFGTLIVLSKIKISAVGNYAKKKLERMGAQPSHDESTAKRTAPEPPAPAPPPPAAPSVEAVQ
jgi:hypothetical protein